MFVSSGRWSPWWLSALLLCVSGEKVLESRSGLIQELRAALFDLAREGRTYLGRLAGEQTVVSVQKVSLKSDHEDVCFVMKCELYDVSLSSPTVLT